MIIGDSAVGKMTVGQELAKITQLSLFHNHMVIKPVLDIFVYFIKLIASLETRLERNKTENRLLHKTSKKDLLKSEERLLKAHHHRLISNEGEIKYPNYMKINNDHLTAKVVFK